MRCSECNKPILPVVALDIDGTLADYHGHFINFIEAYLGISSPLAPFELGYDGHEPFKAWGCRCFDIDETTWSDIKLAYRQGAQKRMLPVYRGAKPLAYALADQGAELWLTTTRPHLRLDGIDPDTRAWLQRNQILYTGLLYADDKYEKLAERIEADRLVAVLDDLPELCRAANKAFGKNVAIGRLNDYNRRADWRGIDVVVNLEQALDDIQGRLRAWQNKYLSPEQTPDLAQR